MPTTVRTATNIRMKPARYWSLPRASASGSQSGLGLKDGGALYIVSTPIGNMGDMSFRAVEVLSSAALIVAEDTRHSRRPSALRVAV